MKRALLALCVALAAACGGKKNDSQGGSAEPPKKVISYYRKDDFKSLDPVKQLDQASGELIMNLYDTLLQYDYLARPYELEPDLLTKMPELSADKLTYGFELRDDVRFNDDPCFDGGKGRTLNSDDVIYSIKRFADANLNVKSYSTLQGVVEGMDAFREQTKQLGKAADYAKLSISGLTKVDDRHFTIKLTRPNPLMLFFLASSTMAIVPHEAVERYQDQFENHPVGSGPFFVKQMARRGVIVLAKNPHYHLTYPTKGAPGDAEKGFLAAAGKRLPLVDEVTLPLIEEAQPAMLNFLSGQLDSIMMDRDSFTKLATRDASGFHLKPEYASKYNLSVEPDLSVEFFTFNSKDPVVGKNRALREAFAYAIDTPAYIKEMYNGRGEPLHTMVPLAIAGSERDVPAQWYEHDVAKAKKKLAEAGFPDGKGLPPLVIEYRASTTLARQHFEFMRASLAEVGIRAVASFQTFSAFIQKMDAGNFQIAEQGSGADYPDAESFYSVLYGPNKPPMPNTGSYQNAEYDKLYEQIRYMPNSPERFALFARMNEIVRRDLPIIFTFNYTRLDMYQRWLKNYKRNILVNPPLAYLDVDSGLKAKGVH
jgi:ABC-type transport system substrate-binding protein